MSALFRIAPLIVFVPVRRVAGRACRSPPAGRRSTSASGVAVLPRGAGALGHRHAAGRLVVAATRTRRIGGVRGAAQMISYELPRTLVGALAVRAGRLHLARSASATRGAGGGSRSSRSGSWSTSSRRSPSSTAGRSTCRGGIRAGRGLLRRLLGHPLVDLHDGRVRRHASPPRSSARRVLRRRPGLPGPFGVSCVYRASRASIAVAMMWVKWTFPRMRPDQLMSLAWKVLTPMALRAARASWGLVIPWL